MPRKTIITILLALLIPIPAFAQEYIVKFERPAKVGEKYSLSDSGGVSVTQTANDASYPQRVKSETEDYQVQFAAMAEVLEVDEKGRKVKIAFTVEKFTKIEGSSLTELVPPGKVIIANGNQETSYSLQDGSLSTQAQEALTLSLIDVAEPGAPSYDDMLGTTEPKQVGESWAVNNTLVAKALEVAEGMESLGVSVKPENVSGVAKIAGLEEIGGVEYLDIRAELEAELVSSARLELRDGVVSAIDKAILRFGAQGYFPVDHSIPIQAISLTMDVQYVFKGIPGTWGEKFVLQIKGQMTNQILQTAGLDGQLLQEALNDKHTEMIEALKKAGADDPRLLDLP